MNLSEVIKNSAKSCVAPNQKTFLTLTLPDRDRIAASMKVSKREVELAALNADVWPQRYLRNAGSLGVAGQTKLLQAKVFLLGVGGLGGTVAQLLARMGVGRLLIADGDSYSEDNLNRQAFCFEETLGRAKVQVARSEIPKINSSTEVEVFEGFVGEKDLPALLRGAAAAVDALDNMPSRFKLESACREAGIPLIHGAVAGFTGQVTTIYPGDIGFRAFYGDPKTAPEKGIELELGNLAGIVSTVASLEVQETVKVITGLGRPLRDRLLFIDSLNGAAETISLK